MNLPERRSSQSPDHSWSPSDSKHAAFENGKVATVPIVPTFQLIHWPTNANEGEGTSTAGSVPLARHPMEAMSDDDTLVH